MVNGAKRNSAEPAVTIRIPGKAWTIFMIGAGRGVGGIAAKIDTTFYYSNTIRNGAPLPLAL
ncbi:MAG: hypothetical protein R2814_04135 [Flavobacteriaceae bacterium]